MKIFIYVHLGQQNIECLFYYLYPFRFSPKTPESPNENELMTSYGFYTTPLANAITHNCVKHPLTRHSQL